MCRRYRSVSGVSLSARGFSLARPRRRVRGVTRVPAFDFVESFLEREPFRHLPHDLPRADEIPFELREPEDFRREPALAALREDPLLAVDLIVPDRDDVRADLIEDVVNVTFVPQDGPVDRLERFDHLEPGRLRHDRFVLDLPSRAVPGDDDPEFVAERSGLAEEIHMTGMEEIEDPRRHYTDHERHARTMSCPSRKTRFLARAYAFASCFERARPSSAIISQMVAVGASPAMSMRAVVSSVRPRRSTRSGSTAFRRGTWPGDRNSSAKTWAAHPFSRFVASFAIAANREIVLARSTSVTPVKVSR